MNNACENTVTLWTIQHEAAYEVFEKTGTLRANESFMFCGDELLYAYDWLSEQMKIRIGAPPTGVRYPIWAWYQWEGKRKRRDMRCSGYAPRGTSLVQIEFELSRDDILLSDFDDWHFVLNDQYLPISEEDKNDFENKLRENDVCAKAAVRESWKRIFELERYVRDWSYPLEKKSIQATFWELRSEQVRDVRCFTAK